MDCSDKETEIMDLKRRLQEVRKGYVKIEDVLAAIKNIKKDFKTGCDYLHALDLFEEEQIKKLEGEG
jgi:hypothetical protein